RGDCSRNTGRKRTCADARVLRRDFGLFGGLGFGLDRFGLRGAAPGAAAAVAVASACLRAMAARHFAGWTLRSARNCRFSASLNVASYARRARASYRQATSAKTANAIGTTRGIIANNYHDACAMENRISVTLH